MTRVEKAAQLHGKGYNCAQAVVCSFAEELDVDEETLFRMTEGLGLGMGGMQGTCGALNGACILAGQKNSKGTSDTTNKRSTYKLSAEIVTKFKEQAQATICKELKGVETGKVLTSCPDCISIAVKIAEEVLGY